MGVNSAIIMILAYHYAIAIALLSSSICWFYNAPAATYYEITKIIYRSNSRRTYRGVFRGMVAGSLRLPSPFQPILTFYDGMLY